MELDRLCSDLALEGVAPVAAAGWAARRAGGLWDLSVGGATTAVFDLASLTKPMAAMTVARSRFGPETALGELLPLARGTASEAMTLELLLSHRAGLEAHVSLYQPLVEGRPFSRDRALIEALNARRADCRGETPEGGFPPLYSDLGYLLVGEAMRIRAGVDDFGELVQRAVVEAMGFEGELGSARALSGADGEPGFAARVVPTEVVAWRGGEVRGRVHDENAWAFAGDGACGHAGMFGTVESVLRFGAATHDVIAHRAGPFARGGTDASWLVRERPGGTLRAGFDGKSPGGGSSAGERMGPRAYGHLGFTGTSVWIDPDAEVVVALLTNRVHPTRENVAIRAARPRVHDALFAMATGVR